MLVLLWHEGRGAGGKGKIERLGRIGVETTTGEYHVKWRERIVEGGEEEEER